MNNTDASFHASMHATMLIRQLNIFKNSSFFFSFLSTHLSILNEHFKCTQKKIKFHSIVLKCRVITKYEMHIWKHPKLNFNVAKDFTHKSQYSCYSLASFSHLLCRFFVLWMIMAIKWCHDWMKKSHEINI